MQRRTFLKAVLASSDFMLAPAAYSNLLPREVVERLTIYAYGAGNTRLSPQSIYEYMMELNSRSINTVHDSYVMSVVPSSAFPEVAVVGHIVFFDPDGQMPKDGKSYVGDPDDLAGYYAWAGEDWLPLLPDRPADFENCSPVIQHTVKFDYELYAKHRTVNI